MIQIVMLAWALLLAPPAAASWHGFPVYPAEEAPRLGPEGGFTRLHVAPQLEAAGARGTPEQVRAARQEARKAARAEIAALLEGLPAKAREAGWTQVRADVWKNCHREWVFSRLDDRLRVVRVVLWNDLQRDPSGQPWGTLEYRYQERPAPHLQRGFPLCAAPLPAGAVLEEETALGLRLVVDEARCGPRDDALPAHAGFARQGVVPGPYLWQKGDLRVLQENLPGKTAYTFVAPDRAEAARRRIGTREEFEADVDPSAGCL